MTYNIIENIVPNDIVEYLQEYTLEIKSRIKSYENQEKLNGSGIFWKGLDMASSCELCTDFENKKLYDIYTSKLMYDVITPYIPNPFLFNDQIVVKEPHEEFSFEPHRDNQFGPFPNDKDLLTINCMLVLDDFTEENGAISVFDKEWITLYPKKGDILMIEGNTFHSSKINLSNQPRRVYLCVYSDRPIGKNFQKGFYYEKFVQ